MTKTNIIGEAYFKKHGKLLPKNKQRITIFLAKIAKYALDVCIKDDEKLAYSVFLNTLLDTELHEHLHIFYANMENHPYSECQVNFWVEKLLPVVAEVIDYSCCYNEILVWLENEVKKGKVN